MPRRFIILSLLAVAAGIGIHPATAAPALPVANSTGRLAAPPQPSHDYSISTSSSLVLAPHGHGQLSVRVRRKNGTPAAGLAVAFVAPSSGPTGTFAHGSGTGKHAYRTKTNKQGRAKASFVAGGRGVYLVDAALPTKNEIASFGISVGSYAKPKLSAAAATAFVRKLVPHAKADTLSHQLFGPVLLPSGARFSSVGPASVKLRAPGGVAKKPIWLFWIDDDPTFLFAHPTRFVTLDASVRRARGPRDITTGVANQATVGVLSSGWWPQVLLPGTSSSVEIFPPSWAPEGDPTGQALARLVARLAPHQVVSDECAIVIRGSTEDALERDARRMTELLRGRGVQVYTSADARSPPPEQPPPASWEDLQALIDKVAKNPNCKKFYLFIATHGYQGTNGGSGGFVLHSPTPQGTTKSHSQTVSYTMLANQLYKLKAAGIQNFNIIMMACYSGQVLQVMDDWGINGTVVSSSAANHGTHFLPWYGSYFTGNLIDCFKEVAADPNHHGPVTLKDAIDCLKNKKFSVSPLMLYDNPSVKTVTGHPLGAMAAPDVLFDHDTGSTLVKFTRPSAAPSNRPFHVFVNINDRSIANFPTPPGKAGPPQELQVTIPAGQDTISVPIDGLSYGVTGYSVTGYANGLIGHPYYGHGNIYVGSRIEVTPSSLTLIPGSAETVTVTLVGAVARKQLTVPGYETHLNVLSNDSAVAEPTVTTLVIPHGKTEEIFAVGGGKVGSTTVNISDNEIPNSYLHDFVSVDVKEVPKATFSLPAIHFGTTQSGTSIPPIHLTIGNSGSSPLIFGGFSIGGPNAGAFLIKNNTCTGPLPLGGDCGLDLGFDPTTPGTYNGILQIDDNAPGSPQQIPLDGILLPQQIALGDYTADYQVFGSNPTYFNMGINILTQNWGGKIYSISCPGEASGGGASTPEPSGWTVMDTASGFTLSTSTNPLPFNNEYLFQMETTQPPATGASINCQSFDASGNPLGGLVFHVHGG